MKRCCGLVAVCVALLAAHLGMASALVPRGDLGSLGDNHARLEVLASDSNRLVFSLWVPAYQVQEVEVDGQRFSSIIAAGLDQSGLELPHKSVVVGLPPDGKWTVKVAAAESNTTLLEHPLAPTGTKLFTDLPSTHTREGIQAPSYDSTEPVVVGEEARIRGLRIVRIEMHPFLWHRSQGTLEHYSRLELSVRFASTASISREAGRWDSLLERLVLNYPLARDWRMTGRSGDRTASTNPPATTAGSLKVWVDSPGLYRLGYDELEAAGFDVGTNPAKWQLTSGGQPIATWVEGEGDGQFDPGDSLVFYGEPAGSRFTTENVYWLTAGHLNGQRMTTRHVGPDGFTLADSCQSTVHFEENHLYDPIFPEANGDHWYWTDLKHLTTDCPQSVQLYPFTLSHRAAITDTATLRLSLQGYTGGTHHLSVEVNDHYLGEAIWQDYDRWEGEFPVDPAWIFEGENELALENGDCQPENPNPNGTWFNYFEVEYQALPVADDGWLDMLGRIGDWQYQISGLEGELLLFDVTTPVSPVILTGWQVAEDYLRFADSTETQHRYLAQSVEALRTPRFSLDQPSDLLTTTVGADYLVIGYSDFLPAVQPLVDLRQEQGWQHPVVVDVEDVYDEFSHGLLDPEAIRTFLAALQPLPEVVLLVGDGCIDYLDHQGGGWRNFIPVYPADVDPWWIETASDNQYACVDGDDNLPDLHLGRLAVSTAEETEAVVQKIVGYETGPNNKPWSQQALLVADNADLAGDFVAISEELYHDYLPPELEAERIYLVDGAEQAYEYEPEGDGLEAARSALRGNWDAGKLLITFIGHSSQSQWAHENLFHRDDVPSLQTGGRLPVVVSLTCYVNAFQIPLYAPLGERLVLEPEGGAVASWGPTGGGLSTGHRYLAQGFISALSGPEIATLGDATFSGKIKVFQSSPLTQYLIDTFALLGDPAMTIRGGELWTTLYLALING